MGEIVFVNEQVVSKVTGIALQTLRNDRHNGRGFAYYKRGKSVRYKLAEVLDTMERFKVEVAADA